MDDVERLMAAMVTSLGARQNTARVTVERASESDDSPFFRYVARVYDDAENPPTETCSGSRESRIDALRALCTATGLTSDGGDPIAELRERADLDSRIAAAAVGATARKHFANEQLRLALAECLALLDAEATCYRCGCSLLVNPALPYCDPGCDVSDDDGALEVRADAHERAVQKRHDAAREAARLALGEVP